MKKSFFCSICNKTFMGYDFRNNKHCCSRACYYTYRSGDLRERFESYIMPEPNTGCWLWCGAWKDQKHGKIYGTITIHCHSVRAHRVAWELYVGPVPKGLKVLHKCDVQPCVNPSHLFLGTQKDNVSDCYKKGRRRTKLSREQIIAIRHEGGKN